MPDVFISHARDDAEFAARIGEGLSSRGLAVWLDEEDVEPGAQWANAVDKAIGESRNVLFLLSDKTNKSGWLRMEAAIALSQRGKRLIPVYCSKDAEVPFMLRPFKGMDLSEPATVEAGIERLADLLRLDAPESEEQTEVADSVRERMAMAERLVLEREKALYEAHARATTRMMSVRLSIVAAFIGVSALVVGIVYGTYPQAILPVVAMGSAAAGFAVRSMLGRIRRTAERIEGSK